MFYASETIDKFGQIFYLSYFPYFLIFIRYFYVLMNGKFTDPVEFFLEIINLFYYS